MFNLRTAQVAQGRTAFGGPDGRKTGRNLSDFRFVTVGIQPQVSV